MPSILDDTITIQEHKDPFLGAKGVRDTERQQ
jgi:hypothetical protein